MVFGRELAEVSHVPILAQPVLELLDADGLDAVQDLFGFLSVLVLLVQDLRVVDLDFRLLGPVEDLGRVDGLVLRHVSDLGEDDLEFRRDIEIFHVELGDLEDEVKLLVGEQQEDQVVQGRLGLEPHLDVVALVEVLQRALVRRVRVLERDVHEPQSVQLPPESGHSELSLDGRQLHVGLDYGVAHDVKDALVEVPDA